MSSYPSLTLDPIRWPESDEYHDPAVFRACERFWWHQEIRAHLEDLERAGFSAACLRQIASNLQRNVYDIAAYLRQMLGWGELIKTEPLHDFEPETWVKINPEEAS